MLPDELSTQLLETGQKRGMKAHMKNLNQLNQNMILIVMNLVIRTPDVACIELDVCAQVVAPQRHDWRPFRLKIPQPL